jgi:hypothetical protein
VVLRLGMEVVPMIVLGLVLAAAVAMAFGAVVVGVQATERRMRLRDSSYHGRVDAFARKVLGVYVRQAPRRRTTEGVDADRWPTGRR